MTIENMISSIGNAVQSSHKMIELNSVSKFFDDFFEKQIIAENPRGEAVYKPKTVKIALPCGDDGASQKTVLAPVAVLVQHNNMNIDYVKINLNINVTDESGDVLQVTSQPPKDLDSNNLTGEMEIMFKCGNSPEGVARIETQMNSII